MIYENGTVRSLITFINLIPTYKLEETSKTNKKLKKVFSQIRTVTIDPMKLFR